MFLQVRGVARRKIAEMLRTLFPELDEAEIHTLTTCAIAGADGLFVQREITGDAINLMAMFELHAQLVHEAERRMAAGGGR